MISKIVTPPPAAPPQAPDKAPPVENDSKKGQEGPTPKMNPADMANRMKMEEMMTKRNELKKTLTLEANGGKPLPAEDGITSDYFRDHNMGSKGLSQADQDAANAKRVNAEVDAKLQKLMPMPSGSAGRGGAKPLSVPSPPKE